MERSSTRTKLALAALSLVPSLGVVGCNHHDEPEPPSQDTGALEPDCNQAFHDALAAGLCQPPGSLVINFDLGSTEYIYVDDPYFEAVGALGVFGPGIGAAGGGGIAGGADSIARVLESNGTCEILCAYDVITCNDEAPICVGFFGGSCLYCNDVTVTIEQCQDFLNGCSSDQGGSETEASGTSTESETAADSTS